MDHGHCINVTNLMCTRGGSFTQSVSHLLQQVQTYSALTGKSFGPAEVFLVKLLSLPLDVAREQAAGQAQSKIHDHLHGLFARKPKMPAHLKGSLDTLLSAP